MHRLLSLKVELWAVILVVLLGFLAAIGFASAALDGERSAGKSGTLARTALFLADIPDTIGAAFAADNRMQAFGGQDFSDKPTGWAPRGGAMPAIEGYLLQSRYDGSLRHHVVELVSTEDWAVRHKWVMDAERLNEGFALASHFAEPTNWQSAYYRSIHPYLTRDGGLIVKDQAAPLVRVDACGRRQWIVADKLFHHSTEADADGDLWVPGIIEPSSVANASADLFEDSIIKVDQAGQILFEKSVLQLLMANDLNNLIFGGSNYTVSNKRRILDPTHLNDIEPALSDGPYWQRGDLFLSLRNLSAVLLYRPTTDRIIWMKMGPWIAQHDVDILDDHRISLYDNHVENRGGTPSVERNSRVLVYDFATDTVTDHLPEVMSEEKMKSPSAALYTALPGGYHLIEDATQARLLIAGPDKKMVAEFVNRADDGLIYQLGWSRFVPKSEGDAALASMKGMDCDD